MLGIPKEAEATAAQRVMFNELRNISNIVSNVRFILPDLCPPQAQELLSPLSHFLVNFLQPETVRRLTNPHPRTLFLSSDPKLRSAQTLQNFSTAFSTLNFGANLTGMPERHALGLCKLHIYPSLDLNYGRDNRAIQNGCYVLKRV